MSLSNTRIELANDALLLGELNLIEPVIIKNQCRFYSYNFFDSYSYIGAHSSLRNITLGRYSSLEGEIQGTLGVHPIDGFSSSQAFLPFGFKSWPKIDLKLNFEAFRYSVKIGHDVTIKRGVCFRKNAKIGHGAIIEEGAMISKDVSPYAIVAKSGTMIGQRFSDEIIADLIASEWWNYDIPVLQRRLRLKGISIPLHNPKDFLQFLKDQDPESLPALPSKGISIVFHNNIPAMSQISREDKRG